MGMRYFMAICILLLSHLVYSQKDTITINQIAHDFGFASWSPTTTAAASLRRCSVRIPPIAEDSLLLPPVGVWAVSQSQCGRSPSQVGYVSLPW